VNRQQLERTLESVKAENAALKLRLANRTAQVELLLLQLDDIRKVLADAGMELTYKEPA
jgi:hypothetical protein